MITFQQLIHRLITFWENHGCVFHQGHDLEVGAGTFNPATFFRCLGPEPYKTVYVEPSRRPSDGRYGENPWRMQLFHQGQVILKPSPSDVQATYLKSLQAIGFNLKEHDIRFVYNDWEGPTLGAWGLGWEVWMDGGEISQFTYFQCVGSLPLKPVCAEITYGLERLAMLLQKVNSFYDIKWNEELTLGDISHQNEVEWSAYNFTEASTEMWSRHFEDYEKEAKDLLTRHLPIPAYDFVIKASHAFNILDARGAISVTERTGYIARIRDLSRLAAMEYLDSREKQGFPLLPKQKKVALPKQAAPLPAKFNPKKTQDFLLEIGSEELPANFVPIGCKNLEKVIKTLLEDHELNFKQIHVYGTPRRLAVHIEGLVEGTPSKTTERRGPPVTSSFDQHGKPTAQGSGFLKSLGHPQATLAEIRKGKIKNLEVRSLKDTEYLFSHIEQPGISTGAILAEHLPKLILNLDFPKKMRWGDLDIAYPRPLHWIVALFGNKIVPFIVGDIATGRNSFGHAQLKPTKCTILRPKEYLDVMRKHFVLADIEERRRSILKQLGNLEKKIEGQALELATVLPQVLHLTEWPKLTFAEFNPNFLKAPPEVLISEMVEHQKYFPVADKKGKLKNLFIITADTTPNNVIRKGNEKVLSARLADGVFLYEQDLETPLEKFNGKLKEMTFQKDLGSMLEKVTRICSHTQKLNALMGIADQKKALRAALLCKADLASLLVGEFPDLQGTVGKYYALAQKEDKEVAAAIEEHWMPKGENTHLPKTPCGVLISLADKLDNLLGYYSVGLKPTSSSDPYALRRQTIGIIKILIDGQHTLNLKQILDDCSDVFP
ncbi:MAG TPA: glycine--tRNA ligase subunit beta, partial [Rhabdochlamydiaceae bacterium]|nr:glycine--tRNA ligase subunit beta [Rhabdochlamydiaceae bacterium]